MIKCNTKVTVHLNQSLGQVQTEDGEIIPLKAVTGIYVDGNEHWFELVPEQPAMPGGSIFIPMHAVNFIQTWL